MSLSVLARRFTTANFPSFKVIGYRTLQTPLQASSTATSRRTFASSPCSRATKWYYAVRKGIKPGVYESWEETKAQVIGRLVTVNYVC